MALNTVTLTWSLADFLNSSISDSCTLSVKPTKLALSDTPDGKTVLGLTRLNVFVSGTGSWAGIIANDNGALIPANSAYRISIIDNVTNSTILGPFTAQVNFSNGATQDLSTLYVNRTS